MKLAAWLFGASVAVVILGLATRRGLGDAGLNAWGIYLTGAGTLILAFAACFTGYQAIAEYRGRTSAEQIRWVFQLFQQFFQDHKYQLIRQKIDYDDLEDIVPLMERDTKRDAEFAKEERDLLDSFTDFLNFFEMIAYMIARKQLAAADVRQVFDYYLRRMTEIRCAKELFQYLSATGFENLSALLLQYSSEKSG
jgi:hypothetical protein